MIYYFFPILLFDFGKSFLPVNLINRFNTGTNIINFASNRFEIWEKTLFFIKNRPLLGWGAGIFPILYIISSGQLNAQHTHNLLLHLAFTYGFPLAISMAGMVFNTSLFEIKKTGICFPWVSLNFIA